MLKHLKPPTCFASGSESYHSSCQITRVTEQMFAPTSILHRFTLSASLSLSLIQTHVRSLSEKQKHSGFSLNSHSAN